MEKSILEKNLEQVSRYNPILANKISEHTEIEKPFEFLEAKSGDIILRYDGILLHDDIDPQEEAYRILNNLSNNVKSTVNVLYGMGIGYVFKRFSLSCKGKIILYEPNLDILRIAFEVVDFSEDLRKDIIAVVDTKEDLEKAFERFFFGYSHANLSFLDSYEKLYPGSVPEMVDNIAFLRGLFTCNYANLFQKFSDWSKYGIENIPEVLSHLELEPLRDKFKNKPAVIISAGPSLDKNIDILKEFDGKVLTFCVGTALKTAVKHGIKPDFLTIVEFYDCIKQIAGTDTSDINLILQPSTHKNLHNLDTKRKFNFYPNNDLITQWLCNLINVPLDDYLNKGTVSLCALFSARILGCNPIIIIGQDLAYTDGKCYSKDTPYSNLVCKLNNETNKLEVAPDNLDEYIEKAMVQEKELAELVVKARFSTITKDLYFVKGQNGEMLPTEPGYATFIRYFENTANQFGDSIKLINSTEGGAQIDGFENIPLRSALDKYATEEINAEDIIEKSLYSARNITDEKGKVILEKLDETINIVESNITYFEQGNSATIQMVKDYKNSRLNSDSFKKHCQKVLLSFIEIEEKIIHKSILVQGLILPNYSRLAHYLANREDNLDAESIRIFVSLSNYFFITGYDRFKEDFEVIKKVREKLYESCNSTR